MNIKGTVVRGDGYGRKLGFPTANIEIHEKLSAELSDGIYAGYTLLKKDKLPSAIIVSFGGTKIESHILDWSGDIYGQTIELVFGEYIRSYKKFNSEKDLRKAIKGDIEKIQKIV